MKLPDMLEFIAVGFKADRFKTLMSSLGIIIGVMAIVVMLSVGEGLYSGVSSQFTTLNLDVIRVMPGSVNFGGPAATSRAEIRQSLPSSQIRTPRSWRTWWVSRMLHLRPRPTWWSPSAIPMPRPASPAWTRTRRRAQRAKWQQGRFLTGSDYKSIVIGNGVSQDLFRMKITPGNKIRLYL